MDARKTEYYQGLAREPSIASQLPVVFANGNRWEAPGLRARCHACSEIFPDHFFTGRVHAHNARMTTLDALGFCPDCKKVTPCHYRLYDDRRFEGKNADGQWTIWTAGAKPWWQRLLERWARSDKASF